MDFGCGLGQDGLHFAKALGLEVVFADIVPSNVKLTNRYAVIWRVLTKSVHVDDPKSFDFTQKFGLIFANGVLHHSPEAKEIVQNLKCFLNINGLFIVMLYTKEHYKVVGARSIDEYAMKSESPAPVPTINPYTEYYDVKKAQELFEGFMLIDQWTTHNERFGWYCFKMLPQEMAVASENDNDM